MEMRANDVERILERLDTAGVARWLDGGWGVDALLGEPTRIHADLDLIVSTDAVPAMLQALAADGFTLVEGEPGSNFVLRDAAGQEIDVHPARFDEAGNGVYRMANGEDWIYPAAGFAGRGTIGLREVRCLTPEVQILCHAGGYAPADTDFHDMRLLHDRFGTELLPPYDVPPPKADTPTQR